MKKNLTFLTGIVFLITILVAGGCESATTNDDSNGSKDLKRVTIYLQAHEIDEEMHLKMYDSNDLDKVVVDTLHTVVQPGTKVIWKLVKDSGIEKVEKIGPTNEGEIIIEDATKIIFTKRFKLKIPKNATPGEDEYDIDFKAEDGKTWKIDPYLKIPR